MLLQTCIQTPHGNLRRKPDSRNCLTRRDKVIECPGTEGWRCALVVAGCLSLVLIVVVDRACYGFLAHAAPAWKILPDLRITSLALCLVVCGMFARDSLGPPLPAAPWRLIAIASLCWLSGSVVAVFLLHVWTPVLPSWIDRVSFAITGLLAEELLFRGAVFSLAERVFPPRNMPVGAIAISAILYGAQHLGYHGWSFTPAAIAQITYTTVFGILLGSLRAWSGTLWVPVALHFANNLVTVLYRALGN